MGFGQSTKIQTAARCESLNLVSAEISSAVLISSRNAKFNHTLKNISDFFLNGHKIGSLKAAYHWNCVGCHEEMDGPTDCQDCHARTPEGDAFYRADATGSSKSDKGGH